MTPAPDRDRKGFMSALKEFMRAAMFTAESGFFAAARLREGVVGALEPAPSPGDASVPADMGEPPPPGKGGVEGDRSEGDLAGRAPYQGRHHGRRPAHPAPGAREQPALRTE